MTATTSTRSAGVWVATLCWLAVLLDGFDLVVLGAVLPSLLDYRPWGLTPASASLVTTAGLVGMTIGALTIGTLTDVVGRRKALIGAVASFSVFTLLCAFAPGPGAFGVLRFLAGLGLGGCLPTAIALVNEFTRGHRGGRATTTVMTGYHVGAVLTALLALWLVEDHGWESMFVVGGVAGLLVLPVLWVKLPESESYLQAVADRENGTARVVHRSADVVRGRYLRVSIGLWVASFMGLLLVYGLNTWLPKIMGEAGYSINAGTTLLLVLNLGAVIGLLVAGGISDKRGNKPTVLVWFGLAAVFLALLSIKIEHTLLVYAAVLLAGVFVFSAQVLVYAFVGHLYPPEIRGTALGMAAGVGRIGAIVGPTLGGLLVTAGIAYPWGFYAFAVAAVLAVVALSLVPAHLDPVRLDTAAEG